MIWFFRRFLFTLFLFPRFPGGSGFYFNLSLESIQSDSGEFTLGLARLSSFSFCCSCGLPVKLVRHRSGEYWACQNFSPDTLIFSFFIEEFVHIGSDYFCLAELVLKFILFFPDRVRNSSPIYIIFLIPRRVYWYRPRLCFRPRNFT